MPTPALTLDQSDKIIDVVIDAGLFEPPKPTGAALIDTAANIVKSASAAKRMGNSNNVIQKVLDLSSPLNNVPSLDSIDDVASTATEPENQGATDENNVSSVDTAASSTDSKLIETDREKESTHYLDHDNKIEIPDLPRDFSKVGDLELRTLHAERHGILSKVIFELGLETADYESAQVNYDQTYKANQNEYEGTVTERRDASFLDPEVIEWREKVDAHHKRVIMLRAYRELLESEIKGLSREFTMRTGERNTTP